MKRLFILLLTVLTLLAVLPLGGAAIAADTPAVVVSSTQGEVGSEVKVTISLSGNPGITAFRFKLSYDANLLELKKAEFPELLSSPAAGGALDANPYIISWYSAASKDETANGVFATLTFKIKDGAKTGSTKLSIDYDQVDLCDSKFKAVSLAKESGTVSITCTHVWDDLGIGCTKCGTHDFIAWMQEGAVKANNAKDFRVLLETTRENYGKAKEIIIRLDFYDQNMKDVREGKDPIELKIDVVFETVYANGELLKPSIEGGIYCGLIVTDIPQSAGVKYVHGEATFVAKDGKSYTYVMGTAILP